MSTPQILLSTTGQVFVNEINAQSAQAGSYSLEYLDSLTVPLERLLHVMAEFGPVCPLMGS